MNKQPSGLAVHGAQALAVCSKSDSVTMEHCMKAIPLGVVTSCRKLAGSFRMGQSNPRLLKKGIASSTGPWKHTCLHVQRQLETKFLTDIGMSMHLSAHLRPNLMDCVYGQR